MFGMKKRKEKKQQKRDLKSDKELVKNRTKYETKFKKTISKKLNPDETISGIVAYNGSYIIKTSKNRFFIGGVQGLRFTETILTKDKILNISKSGLLPANINVELLNGNIRLFSEANVYKVDKLYMDTINLVG